MPALLLALNVVALVCALYITVKAFQDSVLWGLFFLFTPVVYYLLTTKVGPVIAGAIVIGLQLFYVKNHWSTVGKAYMVIIVLFLGSVVGSLAFAE